MINVKMKIRESDDLLSVFDKASETFVILNTRGTKVKLPDLVSALTNFI